MRPKSIDIQFIVSDASTEQIESAEKSAIGYTVTKRNHKRRALRHEDRVFIAIDGEGITHPGNKQQSYVLLGMSDGVRKRSIRGYELTTKQCLNFLAEGVNQYPNGEYVAFAFNYDVSMICKDLNDDQLLSLKTNTWTRYQGYSLQWRPGKWFTIKDKTRYLKIYDVFSFFGCKFTTAIEQYIPDSPELENLTSMKARRGGVTWTIDQLDSITDYMFQELVCMVRMMDKLKGLLLSVNVKPTGWHGPGAVATSLLTRHKIKDYREKLPDSINRASQYAYYGGRFESLYCGKYDRPVYQYDINSAYPYALTNMPSITGNYDVISNPPQNQCVPPFSLCQVYFNSHGSQLDMNPIALRNNKNIYFPGVVKTWIWGVEYNELLNWKVGETELMKLVILEDDGTRPFEFIGDLYEQRAQWKREGNPAQLAAKLGMNSMYGKLAQRVGWNESTMEPPRNHQLSWAGYITATCRAMILSAINQAPDNIIAVETDAIFSTCRLDLPLSSNLGHWDCEEYTEGIMYVQSGVYFVPDDNGGWSKAKTRGFNNGPQVASDVLETLDGLQPITREAVRFHSLTGPLSDKLRTWENHEMVYVWGGSGKRMHIPSQCPTCNGQTIDSETAISHSETWHRTSWMVPNSIVSQPHPLPWLGES